MSPSSARPGTSYPALKYFLLAFLISTVPFLQQDAWSQADTGRVQGTVLDPTGAVVPNATVKITNDATNRVLETTSAADTGVFSFPGLQVGRYTLNVQARGFAGYTQPVQLDPGQVVNAQVTLQAGNVSQSVTVTEEAGVVDSATSDIGSTIRGRQVTELPLNGRNFTQLATLVPGVSRGVPTSAATGINGNAETFRYGNVGGAALVVNGLRPQANNFLLDGADNNESLVNTIVFFPSPDAVQEFRLQTSVAPAEYGRAGGAIVNTSIKSGSNEIHGSAFEYLRNSDLDARPTFATDKTPFRRNQFGGTIGFPVIKNKFFLFGDYQGLRQSQPLASKYVTVPTAAMRNGDFSALLDPSVSGLSQPYIIHDVTTGLPYANNIIPASQINKVGQNYLNAFPLPTLTNQVQQNYYVQEVQTQQFDDFDIRGDYILSQNDLLFGRFSYGQDSSTTSSEFPNLPAGFGTGSNFNQPRGFVLGETHTFSPSLINELRLNWQREYLGYNPPLGNQSISANLGIPNANTSPLLGGGALIGGFGSQIEYTGDYGLYAVPQNTYQIVDSFTKVFGRHSVKFGANLIWRQVNYFRPKAGKGYFFLYGNGQGPGSTGYEVSDLLAGFVNNYQIGAQTGYFGTRSWEDGFFLQDDWKVTSRLTLNLGLRYDYLSWPTEQFDRQSNFDLSTGTVALAGKNGYNSALIHSDNNNFAPRVGFAYLLTRDAKTVLRGGYGMFYFIDRGGIDNQLGQNPPFSGIAQYDYTNGYRITLSGAGSAPASATGALPAAGFPSSFDPNNPANISMVAALMNNRTPYVQQYNVQLQREVFRDSLLSIGYVGTAGRKLSFYYNANQQYFNAAPGARLYPNLGSITVLADRGISDYNSLQIEFEKRMSKGLQFRAAYTYSKNIDDGDGAFDGAQPQDINNFALERGPASTDQRHLFVASSLYELPFGRGRTFGANWSRPLDTVLGGWQLNGIWTWQSGLPLNITQSATLRPDVTGPIHVFGSTQGWFDTSVLVPVAQTYAGSGVYTGPGNLGRNGIYGPGNITLDMSVFKNFPITERIKLEFRSEFFNIANHPHYAQPDTVLGDANFGKITSTLVSTERQIQFGARVTF
jgi:hypothetical protein